MPGLSRDASIVSLPAPLLTVNLSFTTSAPMMLTCSGNPLTENEAPAPIIWIPAATIWILSSPAVPSSVT